MKFLHFQRKAFSFNVIFHLFVKIKTINFLDLISLINADTQKKGLLINKKMLLNDKKIHNMSQFYRYYRVISQLIKNKQLQKNRNPLLFLFESLNLFYEKIILSKLLVCF